MDDHLDDDSGIEIKQEATEVQTFSINLWTWLFLT